MNLFEQGSRYYHSRVHVRLINGRGAMWDTQDEKRRPDVNQNKFKKRS